MGQYDEANTEKLRLEQKQRAARKAADRGDPIKPLWFDVRPEVRNSQGVLSTVMREPGHSGLTFNGDAPQDKMGVEVLLRHWWATTQNYSMCEESRSSITYAQWIILPFFEAILTLTSLGGPSQSLRQESKLSRPEQVLGSVGHSAISGKACKCSIGLFWGRYHFGLCA